MERERPGRGACGDRSGLRGRPWPHDAREWAFATLVEVESVGLGVYQAAQVQPTTSNTPPTIWLVAAEVPAAARALGRWTEHEGYTPAPRSACPNQEAVTGVYPLMGEGRTTSERFVQTGTYARLFDAIAAAPSPQQAQVAPPPDLRQRLSAL